MKLYPGSPPPPSNHLVSSAVSILLKGPACRTRGSGFKLCTIELVALDQGRRVGDPFSNLRAAGGRGSASLRQPDTHIRARQGGDSVPRPEHSFEDLRFCTSPGGQHKTKGGRVRVFLCCELDAPDSLVEFAPHSVRHIEQGIIAALLEGLPHNYTGEMQDQVRRIPAAVVRRAEEFIIAHLKDPLNIGDIAAAAGVSARSLHRNFRRHRGYSPLEFLRLARLKRVRAELETGRPNITVTSVAMDYGFFHLGRFSQFYKRRYGESPCKTLQRYRGAL
ncbi:MAG: helix-turn-helix transcriptional regulator [Deltaproteobacteria bacterium]|nr:helix-turn-helix transcriptional regulator [Deltaproteobacteria bacterium]